jgi:hypothetical protein
MWLAPVLVNALLIATLVAVANRSGGEPVAGAVGVTVSASGSPVLVIEVCRGSVDTVTVVGPHRGAEPNEQRARLTSRTPVNASISVDIVRPTRQWTGSPLSTPLGAMLVATAGGPQGSLRQVSFSAADLASLDPSTVLYAAEGAAGDAVLLRAPLTTFSGLSCAGATPGG